MVFGNWRGSFNLDSEIIQALQDIKKSGETITRAANTYLRNPSALYTTAYSYLFEEEVNWLWERVRALKEAVEARRRTFV